MYYPAQWCIGGDLQMVLVYLVDDGTGPRAAFAFHQADGTFGAPSEVAKSSHRLGGPWEALLISHVEGTWARLCTAYGVVGIDRPARVVVIYMPTMQPKDANDKNMSITMNLTPARIGMPAVSGVAGMAEWLGLLQTSETSRKGFLAAEDYLTKFSDTHGDGDIGFQSSRPFFDFILNPPEAEQQLLRFNTVLVFQKALVAILPGLLRAIWEKWALSSLNSTSVWVYGAFSDRQGEFLTTVRPGDGEKGTHELSIDVIERDGAKGTGWGGALEPLLKICGGTRGVDFPARIVLKYSPKTPDGEVVEVDLTWLPEHSGESYSSTMLNLGLWVGELDKQGEEAARYLIHSTPALRSRTGDISMVGNPTTLEASLYLCSEPFKEWCFTPQRPD